jgi:hypothetical protein
LKFGIVIKFSAIQKIESIIEFIKAFDHIVKNPKRELSHTKEFRRTEKVIPIAETYRKLSTSGTQHSYLQKHF